MKEMSHIYAVILSRLVQPKSEPNISETFGETWHFSGIQNKNFGFSRIFWGYLGEKYEMKSNYNK